MATEGSPKTIASSRNISSLVSTSIPGSSISGATTSTTSTPPSSTSAAPQVGRGSNGGGSSSSSTTTTARSPTDAPQIGGKQPTTFISKDTSKSYAGTEVTVDSSTGRVRSVSTQPSVDNRDVLTADAPSPMTSSALPEEKKSLGLVSTNIPGSSISQRPAIYSAPTVMASGFETAPNISSKDSQKSSNTLYTMKSMSDTDSQSLKYSQSTFAAFVRGFMGGGIAGRVAAGGTPTEYETQGYDVNIIRADYATPQMKAYAYGDVTATFVDIASIATGPEFIFRGSKTLTQASLKATAPLTKDLFKSPVGRTLFSVGTNVASGIAGYEITKTATELRTGSSKLTPEQQKIYTEAKKAESAAEPDILSVLGDIPGYTKYWVSGNLAETKRQAYKAKVFESMQGSNMTFAESNQDLDRLYKERGIRKAAVLGGTLTSGATSEAIGQFYLKLLPTASKTITATSTPEQVKKVVTTVGKEIEKAGYGEGYTQVVLNQRQEGDTRKLFEPGKQNIFGMEITTVPFEEQVVGAVIGGKLSRYIGERVFKYSVVEPTLKNKVVGTFWKAVGYGVDPTEAPADVFEQQIQSAPVLRGKSYARTTAFSNTIDGNIVDVTASESPFFKSASKSSRVNVPSFTSVPVNIQSNVPVTVPSNVPVMTSTSLSNVPSGRGRFYSLTNVPTNVPANIPAEVPAIVPVPSDVPSNIPSDVPTNVPTEVPANIPADVPSNVPVLTGGFPIIGAPGGDFGTPSQYYSGPTPKRKYAYQADFMALVLGQTTTVKPENRIYSGEERRLIYVPGKAKQGQGMSVLGQQSSNMMSGKSLFSAQPSKKKKISKKDKAIKKKASYGSLFKGMSFANKRTTPRYSLL